MTSGTRNRIALSVATFVLLSGLVVAVFHSSIEENLCVSRLRQRVDEITYGPKGGYFVTTSRPGQLGKLVQLLNELSNHSSVNFRIEIDPVDDPQLEELCKLDGNVILKVRIASFSPDQRAALNRRARVRFIDWIP
jgi:hypothetical protein